MDPPGTLASRGSALHSFEVKSCRWNHTSISRPLAAQGTEGWILTGILGERSVCIFEEVSNRFAMN